MKRILQYGLSSNKGGIEVIALNIFRNIDKEKVMFDFLICEDTIAFEEEIRKLGGTVYKITKRKKNPIKHYIDYINFFRKHSYKYAAIHCSYCTLYSIFPIILSKIYNIPQIILHARSNKLNTSKLRLKFSHYINRYIAGVLATDFISCSQLAAKFMFTPKRISSKRYQIVRNPIELDRFRYNEKKRKYIRKSLNLKDAFVLGHVGAFLPVKNHQFIIEIFNELQKINPNSRLILVGGGKQEDNIKKQAEALGIIDKIIFTGVVDNPYDYMQAMDCFVFPSLYEGFGNVLIEAQAAGLSCFVSDTVPKEVKVTNFLEFLSIKDNAQIWVNKILENTNKVARRDKITDMTGFSVNECIKTYENIYHC